MNKRIFLRKGSITVPHTPTTILEIDTHLWCIGLKLERYYDCYTNSIVWHIEFYVLGL